MTLKNLDRFKIKNEVARRLCYTLYEAEDEGDGRTVTLKVLDETRAKDKHAVFNFLNGARVASLLDDPNICKIVHFGSDFGRYFIASEPILYAPFRSLIKPEFALSFDDLIEMFVRIGKTLRYAHLQGAIHGLLNPDTVYINSDGAIKIDDFGFHWYVPQICQRTDKEAMQLAHYISPEFYQLQKFDGRADIYSLGILLYHLIAGASPFKAHSMAALQKRYATEELPPLNLPEKGLPAELETILLRAVSLKEDVRFLNFKDLLESLELLRRGHLQVADAALEPEAAEQLILEKYFEDQPREIDFSSKAGRRFKPKMAAASAAALFIVLILFLIITNRLPLPFTEDDESGIAAEQLLSSLGPPDASSDQPAPVTSSTNIPRNDSLVSAMNDSVAAALTGSFALGQPAPKPDANSNHTTESRPVDSLAAGEKAAAGSGDKPTPEAATSAALPEPKSTDLRESRPPAETAADKMSPVVNTNLAKVVVMVQSQNQPVEAFVFIDNQFKGKTNAQGFFEVPGLEINKNYTVKISKEGHATLTRQFTALEKTPVLNFDITPKEEVYGTLILEALPKADSIFVDGKLYHGQTPLQLTLPWGDHKVRFVNKSLNKSHEQMVSLKVGEVQRIKHNFAEVEFGKIAVSLRNAAQYGFGYVYVDGKLWDGSPNTTPLELTLPVGSHTIEVRRDGFNALPRDIIVTVEKDQTKYVSFTLMKN